MKIAKVLLSTTRTVTVLDQDGEQVLDVQEGFREHYYTTDIQRALARIIDDSPCIFLIRLGEPDTLAELTLEEFVCLLDQYKWYWEQYKLPAWQNARALAEAGTPNQPPV